MLNTFRLHEVLKKYKADFIPWRWEGERYKWEAIQCFQEHWDIQAIDFEEMLIKSLTKTKNLLASNNHFPRKMIQTFAKKEPEEVRRMYQNLFDESIEMATRMIAFKKQADILLEKYENNIGQHYQYENAITTYLWLRFPDKYYIYKYSEVKIVAKELGSNFIFKKGDYISNLQKFYQLYNEICKEVKKDTVLLELFQSQLTDIYYADTEYKTLTADIGIYISRVYAKQERIKQKEWFPNDYFPELREEVEKREEKSPDIWEKELENYSKEDFFKEVYMQKERYHILTLVLKNKKNLILQGAPGVGKTFVAKRLAYSIMGKKDESRIRLIQFHQNYSYEDFMLGYKPMGEGFTLQYGVFYQFCKRASQDSKREYFFIIDEINRGNMSKIFGELLMLIEKDYRGVEITLAYNGLAFSVPKNLYIIGMMNTADRSLAMIDYALRRRFSFFEMEPGFDTEGFIQYQEMLNDNTFSLLILKVKELNKEIAQDRTLGKGFCIGHSYFCGQIECTREWLQSIVDYDILPMLQEYWFDDIGKVEYWEKSLHEIF